MVDILEFIPYYPTIEDDNFNTNIFNKKEFNDLKLTDIEELVPCQNLKHQEFIARFMSGYTLYDGLLLFHEMGTGKTCAAFATTEKILNERFGINKVFVIANNDKVLTNLKNELILKCTNKYLKQIDNYEQISVNKKIRRTKAVLSKNYYNFFTAYNFCLEVSKIPIIEIEKRYSNSIFIIDEVHNINVINTDETNTTIKKYKILHNVLHTIKNSKILLLSGTPMYDQASEIAEVMNLILPLDNQFATKTNFNREYLDTSKLQFKDSDAVQNFNNKTKGRISYLKQETDIKKKYIMTGEGHLLKNIKTFNKFMQDTIQNRIYCKNFLEEKIVLQSGGEEKNKYSLRTKTRQSSLFVFPDGKIGQEGFNEWVECSKSNIVNKNNFRLKENFRQILSDDLIKLKEFSIKYYTVIDFILNKSDNKCVFVYNEFVGGSGLLLLTLLLEHYSLAKGKPFNRYSTPTQISRLNKSNRYMYLVGMNTKSDIQELINVYNRRENRHGEYIKVIFGSSITKESFSFNFIQQTHILTPHWNFSKISQVISRGLRFGSHDELDDPEFNIYFHTTFPSQKNTDVESIDYYIYNAAEMKDQSIKEVEYQIKINAIDCELFKNRNELDTEFNYTRECEYKICSYNCENIGPFNMDYDSYNVYYTQCYLETNIMNLYKKYFFLSYSDLRKYFSDVNHFDILTCMYNIISNNKPILNKYGIPCYVKEQNDIFYLVYDINDKSNTLLNFYNENIISYDNINIDVNIKKDLLKDFFSTTNRVTITKYLDEIEKWNNLVLNLIKVSIIEYNTPYLKDLHNTTVYEYWEKYYYLFDESVYIIKARNKYQCLDIRSDNLEWVECNKGIQSKFEEQIKNEEQIISKKAIELKLAGYGVMYNDQFKLKENKDAGNIKKTGTACNKTTTMEFINKIVTENPEIKQEIYSLRNSQERCNKLKEIFTAEEIIYKFPLIKII